jgi:gluconokinase
MLTFVTLVPKQPIILVVTGVSGSGKTTVGTMLAGRLRWPYADADDFHPKANMAKMAAGCPLTDEDRWPWLQAIGAWIDERRAADEPAVVTCSALKRAYRDLLRNGRPEVRLVYLQGNRDLIAQRLAARKGHFFKPSMLERQLADLEEPAPDEQALSVSIEATPPRSSTTSWRGSPPAQKDRHELDRPRYPARHLGARQHRRHRRPDHTAQGAPLSRADPRLPCGRLRHGSSGGRRR